MMLTKKSFRKDEIRKCLWKKFAENLTEFFQVCVESLSENKQKRESRIRNRNRKMKLVTLRAQVWVG